MTSIYSTVFCIKSVIDPKTMSATEREAPVGGRGRALGLTQPGGIGLPEKGASCDEILKHHNPGVSLEHRD